MSHRGFFNLFAVVGLILFLAIQPGAWPDRPGQIAEEVEQDGQTFVKDGATIYFIDEHGHRTSTNFHRVEKLDNGKWLRTQGATSRLLSEDGNILSGEYQDITPTDEGYRASLGSSIFILDESGRWRTHNGRESCQLVSNSVLPGTRENRSSYLMGYEEASFWKDLYEKSFGHRGSGYWIECGE